MSTTTLRTQIRKRAARYRLISWSSLILILASLAAGTWFFVYASDLSLKDATRQAEFRAVQIGALTAREKKETENLDVLRGRLQAEIRGQSGSGVQGKGPVALGLENEITRQQYELEKVRKEMSDLLSDQVKDSKAASVLSPQFINTVLTRVLVVVLLAYFVQLLSGQYRYAHRLASHLDNTADAIELHEAGVPQDQLAALLKATSPDAIDFGGKSELQVSVLTDLLKRQASK